MINDKKSEEAALSYCAKCLEITNRNIDLDKDECVELPKGSIEKLIGKELSWKDEPVKFK